ncbi:unnamed protein product [Didymodactylos carnosus]|uniref:Uncharacterized protein n=1 Tax=Didymodactylos carnosus TaxID=1234261 RepID=A0A815GEW4_9BILA|nr:unnamed protein product [Didymodactylos carnosus]CAF4196277.1 unnamed protein product [Didymodactylos carnosus]
MENSDPASASKPIRYKKKENGKIRYVFVDQDKFQNLPLFPTTLTERKPGGKVYSSMKSGSISTQALTLPPSILKKGQSQPKKKSSVVSTTSNLSRLPDQRSNSPTMSDVSYSSSNYSKANSKQFTNLSPTTNVQKEQSKRKKVKADI